jgi:hypothetical protein
MKDDLSFFIQDDNKLITRFTHCDVVKEPPSVIFVLREYSDMIDVTDILRRYSRVPRKITSQTFLSCHVMSALLRLGIRALKRVDDNFILISQREDEMSSSFSGSLFWTDDRAFLWSIEHASKWTFRFGCQIKVGK